MARRESLGRLRENRVRRARLDLGGAIDAVERELARRQRSVGKAAQAWEVIVPQALREHTELVRLARGVLTVRVREATVRFQLDRWLRSGGQAALARAGVGGLDRVKLVP